MVEHRLDLHETGLAARLVPDDLREADERVAEKCAEEDAATDERRVLVAHGVERLAVVPEAPALSDGRLVVDRGNAPDEHVVERQFSHDDASLLGAADHVARLVFDLSRPPVLERRHGERGDVVPLESVPVPGRAIGQPLDESQHVDAALCSAQRIPRRFGIVQEVVALRREARDADEPTANVSVFATNIHSRLPLSETDPDTVRAGAQDRVDVPSWPKMASMMWAVTRISRYGIGTGVSRAIAR